MRFRGIALLMHHRASINKVKTEAGTSNAVLNINKLEAVGTERVMDGVQRRVVDKVGHETDNLVDSEGIVYPAGARAGVE